MKSGVSYRRFSPHYEQSKKTQFIMNNSTLISSPLLPKQPTKKETKCAGKRYKAFISTSSILSTKKERVSGSKIEFKFDNDHYFSTKDNSRSNIKSNHTNKKRDESIVNSSHVSVDKKAQKTPPSKKSNGIKKKSINSIEQIYNRSKEVLFQMGRKLGSADLKIKQLETENKLLKEKLKKYSHK